jgi:hypothetical protein
VGLESFNAYHILMVTQMNWVCILLGMVCVNVVVGFMFRSLLNIDLLVLVVHSNHIISCFGHDWHIEFLGGV